MPEQVTNLHIRARSHPHLLPEAAEEQFQHQLALPKAHRNRLCLLPPAVSQAKPCWHADWWLSARFEHFSHAFGAFVRLRAGHVATRMVRALSLNLEHVAAPVKQHLVQIGSARCRKSFTLMADACATAVQRNESRIATISGYLFIRRTPPQRLAIAAAPSAPPHHQRPASTRCAASTAAARSSESSWSAPGGSQSRTAPPPLGRPACEIIMWIAERSHSSHLGRNETRETAMCVQADAQGTTSRQFGTEGRTMPP